MDAVLWRGVSPMQLYVCFTQQGLVLAKAGHLIERDLLQEAQAVGYLGPLPIDRAVAYLEETYPACQRWLRLELRTFVASDNTVFKLQIDRRAQNRHR